MAEVRETHVERDEQGRVTDTKVIIDRPQKKGGFGLGLLLGIVLIAGALLAFAYSQGSFREAGVEADQLAAQVQTQTSEVADNAGAAIENAGDTVSETSETVTN